MAFSSISIFSHFRYRALVLLLVISGIMGLWFGLTFILATNRGLDLTDEGLYLLAADPPVAAANYGFPFGWHTGLLFRLVGYDISAFRTLGALVLVLAGGWLGWSAVASVLNSFIRKEQGGLWLHLMGAAIGSAGSLLYYASLLSTPSYNWLNLFGITLALVGYLNLCENQHHPPQKKPRHLWFFSAVAAAGLFIMTPAKPSSPLLVGALGAILLFLHAPFHRAIGINFRISAWLLAFIAASILSGFWQWPVSDYFLSYFQTPRLLSGQKPLGAIEAIWSLPETYWNHFIRLQKGVLVCFIFGAFMLGIGCVASSSRKWPGSIYALLGLGLGAVGSLFVARATLGFGSDFAPIDRSCFDLLVTAALSLFIVSAIPPILSLFWTEQSKGGWPNTAHGVRLLSIAAYLLGASFVYGFGSGNTPYRMAAEAVVFLLVGVAVLHLAWRPLLLKASSFLILLVVTSLLVASTLIDAHEKPYRQKAISEQTVPLRVGRHGSALYVSPDIAEQLTSLRQQAESAGWQPGTPLFGVVWRWASTVPYFLGAKVPDCLILTIFGYPGSVELAQYRIDHQLGAFPAEKAWILTSEPSSLETKKVSELEMVLSALTASTRLTFPRNYQRVALSGDLELWKPKKH